MPSDLWREKQVELNLYSEKGVEMENFFLPCLSFSPLLFCKASGCALWLLCYATPRLFDVTKDSQDETPKVCCYSLFSSHDLGPLAEGRPSILLVFSLFNLGGIQLLVFTFCPFKKAPEIPGLSEKSSRIPIGLLMIICIHMKILLGSTLAKKQTQGH